MAVMDIPLDSYAIEDTSQIGTPALLVYPDLVDANILATLRILGNDETRWRPHIKTAKLGAVLRRLVGHGVTRFKASTTLEVLAACEAGAIDVLLAFPVTGANARRTVEISSHFPAVRISVLVETAERASFWSRTNVDCFIDINPGMNRTGIADDRLEEIGQIARQAGDRFRGLHYYDGHMSAYALHEREQPAHQGYDRLLKLVDALEASGLKIGEVITSGTPAFPFALTYHGFKGRSFHHSISPGTVVFNDATSLAQLPPEYGYVPAVLVLSTIVSEPAPGTVTCDAGHKSVSADAGVPTCVVLGHPDWTPMKPSEEHLPIRVSDEAASLAGSEIYLLPRHVCPTVNNFDHALFVKNGRVVAVEAVTARGHESPLVMEGAVAIPQPPSSLLPVL
jgi:D-serine deaminase-like pyridoxal phosphate-dependent protein